MSQRVRRKPSVDREPPLGCPWGAGNGQTLCSVEPSESLGSEPRGGAAEDFEESRGWLQARRLWKNQAGKEATEVFRTMGHGGQSEQ